MSARSLEDDLLEIPGVEGAELDGTGTSVAGLRIRIAEGADQRTVGGAIRRVLTKHGLGTDTRLPGEEDSIAVPEADQREADDLRLDKGQDEDSARTAVGGDGGESLEHSSAGQADEATSRGEPATTETVGAISPVALLADSVEAAADTDAHVIDLTDLSDEDDGKGEPDDVAVGTDLSGTSVEASPDPGSWSSSQEPLVPPPAKVDRSKPPSELSGDAHLRNDFTVVSRIDSVAVEEGRDGIVVTVSSTDGRSESQPASSTEGGVESAVVNAAARLAQPGIPDPTIIEIEDRRIEGVDIVMIVVDIDGSVAAGSAIVAAGRSFALGRATWAALSL